MKIKLILSISILSSFSLSSAMSETPDEMLYRALKVGDAGLKLAEKAIKLGANVNITYKHDHSGTNRPALIYLIQKIDSGHKIKKTVQLLLESGADVNIQQNDKMTLAICGKNLTALNLAKDALLSQFADLEEVKDVINLIETEVISKEKAETFKKEINEHLLPDISDMVIQYAFLIEKELKKDTNKEVASLSI